MSELTRRAGRRASIFGLCAALALAWVALWASTSTPPALAHSAAAPVHRANSVTQQAVQLDSPAVVRIVSVVTARLTCTGCASDGSDIHSPSGAGTFTFYSSGSGAFISPDGAILTADHVVDHSMSNSEDVAFVESQAAQDVAARYSVTADQAQQYFTSHPTKVAIDFKVTFQSAFLSTAYTDNLPETGHIYAFAIKSIAANSSVDKQDTAIARIDTTGISPAPDFPYLTLSSGPVNALDTVTAIAFPADADLALNNNADFTALAAASSSDVNTINSLLSSSVNSGTITKANEIRSDGTLVYEASSIASNGSSGGPVINDQGQVIGFVDAGPQTDRLTFIIPSAVAAKYAAQAGAAGSAPGRFMGLWTQAMTEYNSPAACHWTTAAQDLTLLKQQYPAFGGVNRYLTQARSQAAHETCASATATPAPTLSGDILAGFGIITGCLVAAIALVVGLIFLVIALPRRRKRRQQAKLAAYSAAQSLYAPTMVMAPPTPRHCPRGHTVVESDAAYCPICGAPMPGV